MPIVPIHTVAIYAHNAGFVGIDLQTIVAICGAESGYNDHARALTALEDSRGLAQINVYAHPWGNFINLYDGATNLSAAWRVYKEAKYSFHPWSTFTSGSYRNFWSAAGSAMGNLPPGAQPPPTVVYIRPPTDVPDDYSGHVSIMAKGFREAASNFIWLSGYMSRLPR